MRHKTQNEFYSLHLPGAQCKCSMYSARSTDYADNNELFGTSDDEPEAPVAAAAMATESEARRKFDTPTKI